jgi:nucleoside-diphosphate-sugar epimerase
MKILVIGASGFIGKRLSGRLAGENHEVVCTGRNLSKINCLSQKIRAVYLDIENKEAVTKILIAERPDVVFHCAGLVADAPLNILRRINVEGSRNIFQACLRAGIKKTIYLSSIAVISGNEEVPLIDELPYRATNAYGQSKLEAELVAGEFRNKGLKIAILRPCMVYGEKEPHLLNLLVKLIRYRLIPILGEGKNKLHMVNVDNVVDVMMLSLTRQEVFNGTYIIADKEALSIREIFCYIADIINARPPLHIPRSLAPIFTGLPIIGKRLSSFMKDRVYSIDRIIKQLGYIPRVSVYDGLKTAVLSYTKRC